MHPSPNTLEILRAVAALLLVTGAVWAVMMFSRVTTMQRLRINPEAAAHTADMRTQLPSRVQRIADNHNHLFEAPTAFYAAALAIAVLNRATPIDVTAAWAFVLLRIIHSVIQTTYNRVLHRFAAFVLSWLALLVLIISLVLKLFL